MSLLNLPQMKRNRQYTWELSHEYFKMDLILQKGYTVFKTFLSDLIKSRTKQIQTD